MPSPATRSVLLLAVLAACAPKAPEAPNTDTTPAASASTASAITDSLRELEQQWADAIRTRDTVALNRIVAMDFVLTGRDTTQAPVPRATWLMNTLTKLVVDSIRISPAEVQVQGDTANATLNFFWAGKFGAMPPFRDSTQLTDKWVRGPAGWQVHRRTTAD